MARKSKEFRQLFYPDSVQKRNPSVTPSQRKKELAAFKSFKQEIENSVEGTNAVFVETPKNLAKMSEVLMEYIEPFLEGTETYEECSNLLEIAVMSWNMALVSEEKGQELLKKIFPGNSSDPEEIEDEKEVQRIVKKLIKRKLKFFAEEKRFITDFKLTENSGRFHISVASSFKM
jgi:hypothetical protein